MLLGCSAMDACQWKLRAGCKLFTDGMGAMLGHASRSEGSCDTSGGKLAGLLVLFVGYR
jgi:hypothetical protein